MENNGSTQRVLFPGIEPEASGPVGFLVPPASNHPDHQLLFPEFERDRRDQHVALVRWGAGHLLEAKTGTGDGAILWKRIETVEQLVMQTLEKSAEGAMHRFCSFFYIADARFGIAREDPSLESPQVVHRLQVLLDRVRQQGEHILEILERISNLPHKGKLAQDQAASH